MKIYVRTVTNKDSCLSLNDLQKCYKKKYVKGKKKNDCRYCIDAKSSTETVLECKSKSYCDINLNNRKIIRVKKNNIDNMFEGITWMMILFTFICFVLDIFYRFDTFTPIKSLISDKLPTSIINNFIGHNFTNVIKFNVMFIILILFLKILYTSLTNNKIKTNETDELIYDDYAFEFDEDSCKISNGNKEKCGKNKNCKYDDGTNLCTFDESSCEKSNGNKEECVKHCKYDDVTSSCTFH